MFWRKRTLLATTESAKERGAKKFSPSGNVPARVSEESSMPATITPEYRALNLSRPRKIADCDSGRPFERLRWQVCIPGKRRIPEPFAEKMKNPPHHILFASQKPYRARRLAPISARTHPLDGHRSRSRHSLCECPLSHALCRI